MLHSCEHAADARKDRYAFHYKFGKATLFITLAPDNTNALLIHIISLPLYKATFVAHKPFGPSRCVSMFNGVS